MPQLRHTETYRALHQPPNNPMHALAGVAPEPWTADALCLQVDPEIFFPDRGGPTTDAKAICARCDVRDQCLEAALARGERFGIWGGLSERNRRKLEIQRAATTPAGSGDAA